MTILFIILISATLVFLLRLSLHYLIPKKIEIIQELISQGKSSQAIRGVRRLIAKNPRDCDAHYLLAKAYTLEGKDELALWEYKAINQIAVFSDICREVDFREEITSLYLKFGEEEEALKEFILLTKLVPQKAEYYYKAGQLFEARNNTGKAVSYYKQAIAFNPYFSDAYSAYGQMMYKTHFLTEAKAALLKAIQQQPDSYRAYFYLGRVYKDLENYPDALVAFENALQNPSLKKSSLIEQGICHLAMKNYEQAQTGLLRAIHFSDENQESNETLHARYYLSKCYEETRQLNKAIEQWDIIDSKKKDFLDIPKKLKQYQDLRADDSIKDFLTASSQQFEQICRQIAAAMHHSVIAYEPATDGALIKAEEKGSRIGPANRRFPRLFRIFRTPDDIALSSIRIFSEQLKKANLHSGYCITCSDFTRSAREYAEIRPIELIERKKLLEIFSRIEISEQANS